MAVKMERYKATKFEYENNVTSGEKVLKLQQNFSSKVDYYGDFKCSCMYRVDVVPAEKDYPFHITAEVVGYFTYDGEMSQTEIHIEAARQLYPFLKAAVTMLTTTAGAPPFLIRHHEIRPEEIKGGGRPDQIKS